MILRDFIEGKRFVLRNFPSKGGLREQRRILREPLFTGKILSEFRTTLHERFPSIGSLWRGAPVIEAIDKRLSRF